MSHAESPPSLSIVNRWMIVLLLMGYAAIGHFNRVGISVAGAEIFIQKRTTADAADSQSPEIAAKKPPAFAQVFTETQMGWVYTAFLVVYTAAMIPGGWLIDRIGAARSLTLLGLTMGSFVMLTGVLGWVMSTPQQLWMGLIVIRGLAGLCSAPLHPGAAHVVSDVTTERGRATGNGMVTAGALLGIAFSYPLFGRLMDDLSWQWAFVVCGGAMIGYALIWQRLATTRLADSHARNAAALNADDSSALHWAILWHPALWLITLSYIAYSYFQYLFFYWMNFYFTDVLHVPEVQSRYASFVIALSQGAGMAIGGLGNDLICRVLGPARGRRTIMLTGMSLGAVFALIAVVWLTDLWQVVLFMSLAMGAQGMCEGVYWTTATEIGGKARGFAGAFMNCGGNVGGFISPVLTPIIAQSLGWPGAIAVACVVCGFGGVLWLWIKPSQNHV